MLMDKVNKLALKRLVPGIVDSVFRSSPLLAAIQKYSTMSSAEIGIARYVEQEHGLKEVSLERLNHGHVGREWTHLNSKGHRVGIPTESGPGLTIRQAAKEGTEPNKMARLLAP